MPSIEALWTVDFATRASGWINGGIAILETGRVFGGDSQFYYLGRYERTGQQVTATVDVTRYLIGPGVTAWGDSATVFEITLTGTILDPIPEHLIVGGTGRAHMGIMGQMQRQGFPPLGLRMVKRAELP